MIKGKGRIRKICGALQKKELEEALDKLPDGENYKFLIVDDKPNRQLPQLTYLFSVLLSAISQQLPGKPGTEALYRYFEDMFAPLHTCNINGEVYEWTDLKREKSNDIGKFIERVAEHARKKWGLEIPDIEGCRLPENSELFSRAYLKQEADWSKFISSKKNKTKHSKDE